MNIPLSFPKKPYLLLLLVAFFPVKAALVLPAAVTTELLQSTTHASDLAEIKRILFSTTPDEYGDKCLTPLHVGAQAKKLIVIKYLINKICYIDNTDINDNESYSKAMQNNESYTKAMRNNNVDIFSDSTPPKEKLINATFYTNVRDLAGKTALHYAAHSDSESEDTAHECINYLLQVGSNPNVEDRDTETPLHVAVKSRSDKCSIALIKGGANTNICFEENFENRYGEKIKSHIKLIHMAIKQNMGELVQSLIAAEPKVIELVSRGYKPLSYAVEHDRNSLVAILLRAGAEVQFYELNAYNQDSNITDPFVLAAAKNKNAILTQLVSYGSLTLVPPLEDLKASKERIYCALLSLQRHNIPEHLRIQVLLSIDELKDDVAGVLMSELQAGNPHTCNLLILAKEATVEYLLGNLALVFFSFAFANMPNRANCSLLKSKAIKQNFATPIRHVLDERFDQLRKQHGQ